MSGLSRVAVAAALVVASSASLAQGRLTLYCSSDEAWCQQAKTEFEKATGVRVDMTRKSSGETYAQIKAEASNPKGDVWWGGTGDPHLQAAEEGLSQAYVSPNRGRIAAFALNQAKAAKDRTIGIYSGALGWGYNEEMLKKDGLPAPQCWADLIKPIYKGKVQMANPNSSGTAYTTLATLVQLKGEDAAFDYLKALHRNINQYTKSGSAPIKAAGAGETLIGIVFMHDAVAVAAAGRPIKAVAPCEGTGYEIGSMSIIKGARNLEAAKKFYEWALTAKAQELGAANRQYQLPSNASAKLDPNVPDFKSIRFIDYDYAKYGSSAERKRLIARWEKDVNSLPR
jgi:iron(III) transport system substrate-binding protein